MLNLSAEELTALKGQGFLFMKDKEHFNCRIVFPAGTATSEEMAKVAELAKKYAQGEIIMTVRLNVEVPGIPYENIEPMKKEMQEAGLAFGGTGARVRPLVACKGSICKFGLIDTLGICKSLHEEVYPESLPHKFKINITGCPNNCAKVQLNDIGFMGMPKNTVRMFVGGRFGRQSIMGEEIGKIPVEKISQATRICMDFFKSAKPKQRFGVFLNEKQGTEEYEEFMKKLKELTVS